MEIANLSVPYCVFLRVFFNVLNYYSKQIYEKIIFIKRLYRAAARTFNWRLTINTFMFCPTENSFQID